MIKIVKKIMPFCIAILICQGLSAKTIDYKSLYENKVKALNNLSNVDITAQYIAEIDGNHEYPELIVAAIERENTGMPINYPFYIFTIKNGKLSRLKNETDVFSGSDMCENIERYIVKDKQGNCLIKEVEVYGPFLDVDYNGKQNTYVSTTVTYLKYIENEGLTNYLCKESYISYDNNEFDTSGKGTYHFKYANWNGKEISEKKYNELVAKYN